MVEPTHLKHMRTVKLGSLRQVGVGRGEQKIYLHTVCQPAELSLSVVNRLDRKGHVQMSSQNIHRRKVQSTLHL